MVSNNDKGILERCFSPDELAFLMMNDQFRADLSQARSEACFDKLVVSGSAMLRSWSPGWRPQPQPVSIPKAEVKVSESHAPAEFCVE